MSAQGYAPNIPASGNGIGKLTLILIIINVALFAMQVFSGVDISHPAIRDALRWGADYAPLTYLAEPYRLFTSMFFHFGIIHLMMNMWALFVFGNIVEQTFGRFFYLGLYLLAGLMGNLFSGFLDIQNSFSLLQQHQPDLMPRVSAGASGAIMGLGGALTALSFLRPIAYLDRKSLVIIMIINICFGLFTPGINNMAHMGGLIMGAVLAICWHITQRFKPGWISSAVVLLLGVGLCYATYAYNMQLVQHLVVLWKEALVLRDS